VLADISGRVPVVEEEWPRDLLQSYSCPQCIRPLLHYFDTDSLQSCGVISGPDAGARVAGLFLEDGAAAFSVQSACVGYLCDAVAPAFLADVQDHMSSSSMLPSFILIGSDAPVDPVMFMPSAAPPPPPNHCNHCSRSYTSNHINKPLHFIPGLHPYMRSSNLFARHQQIY
jgi:hypothetical protein